MTDTITLADRRSTIAAELDTLEREQGAAVLDGKPFDASAIAAKRGEVEAIDAAASEANRRADATEAAEQARQREETRQLAASEVEAYRAAVADAKDRAQALVASLGAIMEHGTRLRPAARALGYTHIELDRDPLETAISVALGQALEPLHKRGRAFATGLRFGSFRWQSSPRPKGWDGLNDLLRPDFLATLQGD